MLTCLVAQARHAWAPQQGSDTPRLQISAHTPHDSKEAVASFTELIFESAKVGVKKLQLNDSCASFSRKSNLIEIELQIKN